jgi:hypothetical protein
MSTTTNRKPRYHQRVVLYTNIGEVLERAKRDDHARRVARMIAAPKPAVK